jgi:hypothetical protein
MRVIREPLLHFLLLGALIFVAYGVLTRHRTDKPGEVVVTKASIDNLVTGFTRTWQRPPTDDELHGLVRDYIREEVAYREALALGLDRDDMIVRRRLRQKLEFVSDDLSTRTQPTTADLQAFMDAHKEKFESESLFSFQQIYFNPQLHERDLDRVVSRALSNLQRSSAKGREASGDSFLLQPSYDNIPLSDVKKTFGEPFASAVAALPAHSWQGPIRSGYGTHLVYVAEHMEGRLPTLPEVRDQVRREYFAAKRREATDKLYASLLSRYKIKIEPAEQRTLALVH